MLELREVVHRGSRALGLRDLGLARGLCTRLTVVRGWHLCVQQALAMCVQPCPVHPSTPGPAGPTMRAQNTASCRCSAACSPGHGTAGSSPTKGVIWGKAGKGVMSWPMDGRLANCPLPTLCRELSRTCSQLSACHCLRS